MFICSRLSILLRRSRMSLSPASSLMPGSRYMHSAPNSVHSLHFGFVPSHRDFLERHTSHYQRHVSMSIHRVRVSHCSAEPKTYRNSCPSSGVVDTSIRISSFQRIGALLARSLLITIRNIDIVRPVLGRLREISGFLGRSENAFPAKVGSTGRLESRG